MPELPSGPQPEESSRFDWQALAKELQDRTGSALLQGMTAGLVAGFHADLAFLVVADAPGDLRVSHVSEAVAPPSGDPLWRGPAEAAMASSLPSLTSSGAAAAFPDAPWISRAGYQSCAAVPLVAGPGRILGAMVIASRREWSWNEEHAWVLLAVASRVSAEFQLQEAHRNQEIRIRQHREQSAALLELSQASVERDLPLAERLQRLLRSDARCLQVARVGLWVYEDNRSQIRCIALEGSGPSSFGPGTVLRAEDFPVYFGTLARVRSVAVSDAQGDERTAEFSESYLQPLGITSMLDVPVWSRGGMPGILCHEHIGPQRTWSLEEQRFAASIADLVARELEAENKVAAERALAQQHRWMAGVLASIGDAVIATDQTGHVRFMNWMAERLTGWSAGEAAGRPLADVFAIAREGSGEKIPSPVEQVMRTGSIVGLANHTVLRSRGGAEVPIDDSAAPIRDDDGELVGVVLVFRDVTERRRMETERMAAREALELERETYRNLVNSLEGVVWELDVSTMRFTFVSEQAERIFGYPVRSWLEGTDFWARNIHEDDRESAVAYCAERTRALADHAFEYRFRTASGGIVWVRDLVTVVVKDGKAERLRGVMVDVTALKLAESLLRGENEALETRVASRTRALSEANRTLQEESRRREKLELEVLRSRKLESLGLLAGGIAHDFNNMLTAILGNVSVARRMADALPKAGERLVRAEAACMRAQELARQLLTFSRGGEPVKAAVALGPLVKDAAEFVLRGTAVKVRYRLDANLMALEADAGQISQVVHNLVLNARQAVGAHGTITLGASNRTVTAPDAEALDVAPGDYVEITIADDGPGIPADHLERIFDPYFTTKSGGSGLGLSTAYSIARRHGGCLRVHSEPGQGATFVLVLPSCEAPDGVRVAVKASASAPGGRVLVMDDDDQIRDMVTAMLQELGYEAVTVPHGGSVVQRVVDARARSHPFDVVILDLTVRNGPGGLEVIGPLLQAVPEVRVVVSSGYSNDPVMSDFRAHGFIDLLPKPYGLDELREVLARVHAPA